MAGLEKEAAESEERSEATARAFVQGELKVGKASRVSYPYSYVWMRVDL